MNDFRFYSPTRFVFGRKVTDRTGEELAALGYRRALIVYGQGSVVRTGTLDRVKASLDAAGVEHIELGGVRRDLGGDGIRVHARVDERLAAGAAHRALVGGGGARGGVLCHVVPFR